MRRRVYLGHRHRTAPQLSNTIVEACYQTTSLFGKCVLHRLANSVTFLTKRKNEPVSPEKTKWTTDRRARKAKQGHDVIISVAVSNIPHPGGCWETEF